MDPVATHTTVWIRLDCPIELVEPVEGAERYRLEFGRPDLTAYLLPDELIRLRDLLVEKGPR
jgi:hypothetical protein